jgi:hypothetical protein
MQILTPEELLQENTTKNLESEIVGYKSEAQKQRKMIYALEKEREKYGQQASDATAKYLEALEEVKIRQMTIMDLQKTVLVYWLYWYLIKYLEALEEVKIRQMTIMDLQKTVC